MSRESVAQLFAAGYIPQLDLLIVTAGRQQLAVGAEHGGIEAVGVTFEFPGRPAVGNVPECTSPAMPGSPAAATRRMPSAENRAALTRPRCGPIRRTSERRGRESNSMESNRATASDFPSGANAIEATASTTGAVGLMLGTLTTDGSGDPACGALAPALIQAARLAISSAVGFGRPPAASPVHLFR